MTVKYFVIKTDQHIVEPGETLYGIDTYPRAKASVDSIVAEPYAIEMVLDLGDVADTIKIKDRDVAEAASESYMNAQQLFEAISAKKLYIPGNHDNPELLYEILGNRWDFEASGCYRSEFHALSILGIDCRMSAGPAGFIKNETALELDRQLSVSEHAIIVMHYPWIKTGSDRIDADLSITNGSVLEDVILRHKSKITAIFHGHLHLWCLNSFHGIPVYGSAGTSFMFKLEPESQVREKPTPGPLGYYLIGIDDAGTLHIRPRYVMVA